MRRAGDDAKTLGASRGRHNLDTDLCLLSTIPLTYALIGSAALALHGVELDPQDIDVLVDSHSWPLLLRWVENGAFRASKECDSEPRLRALSSVGGYVMDFYTKVSSGTDPEMIFQRSSAVCVGSACEVCLASLDDIRSMMVDADRAKDRANLSKLDRLEVE